MEELKENWDHAREHLNLIKKQYPEIVGKLEQRKAAVRIVMAQAKQIDEDVSNHYIPGNKNKIILDRSRESILFINIYKKFK